MASLSRALRRAVGSVQQRTDAAPDAVFRRGTIAAVDPGTATDGNATVTVTVRGSTVAAPYLIPLGGSAASYVPAVGEAVWVQFVDKSPVIVGKVAGFPSV